MEKSRVGIPMRVSVQIASPSWRANRGQITKFEIDIDRYALLS